MIDTAAYAERLEREGDFTPKQARMLAQQRFEIEESVMTKADLANLATKQDINELRLATKQDINELRLTTKQDIGELRQELLVTNARFDLLDTRLQNLTQILKWGLSIIGVSVLIPITKQLVSAFLTN